MTTDGIGAVFLQTRKWGYEVEFGPDHNSGQLRRDPGGREWKLQAPQKAAP